MLQENGFNTIRRAAIAKAENLRLEIALAWEGSPLGMQNLLRVSRGTRAIEGGKGCGGWGVTEASCE